MNSASLDISKTIQAIDVAHLSTGIYIVELMSSDNTKYIEKLVIR